jgi:tungstate transport system substrate-binding protein
MQRFVAIVLSLSGLLLGFDALAENVLKLATTTSTADSGLLPVLNAPFEKQQSARIDVIAVGSGKALKLGENGDVDVVLTHDPDAEERFVSAGHGVMRSKVMYNDFLIVGPASDPAGVKGVKNAADAVRRIAAARASFVSRGDESGTHVKEKTLWRAHGLTPQGEWYLSAGQGMGAVLRMAADKAAYTLTDRGTWLAMRAKLEGLVPLFEGDAEMMNPYHVMIVNPAKHPHVNRQLAEAYLRYLTGAEGQKVIGDFKVDNETLFHPDVR